MLLVTAYRLLRNFKYFVRYFLMYLLMSFAIKKVLSCKVNKGVNIIHKNKSHMNKHGGK